MKTVNKGFLLLVTIFCFYFCGSNQNYQMDFPQEIATVYYQKWIGGQEETGSGTNFHIEFSKPLQATIHLETIFFQNQEVKIEPLNQNTFIARFYQKHQNTDLILSSDSTKEYGNKAPVIEKAKFILQPNEAVLKYRNKDSVFFFKIINIKERPMIAYPSVIKPKN